MQMQASPARADAYRNRPRYRDREGQPAQHHIITKDTGISTKSPGMTQALLLLRGLLQHFYCNYDKFCR